MSQTKQMTHISVEHPTSTNMPELSQRKSSTFISTWICHHFSNTLEKGVFHNYFDILGNNEMNSIQP